MTVRDRWYLTATISFPLVTITAYLLWLWPRPSGTSVVSEVGPYFVSLLTGFPFAWILSRGAGRTWLLLAFLAGGFVVLWFYAVAVLCGVRGVCL